MRDLGGSSVTGGDGSHRGSLALAQEPWRSVPPPVSQPTELLAALPWGPLRGCGCFLSSSWSSCVMSLVQKTSPVATSLLCGVLGEAEQLYISGCEQCLCPGSGPGPCSWCPECSPAEGGSVRWPTVGSRRWRPPGSGGGTWDSGVPGRPLLAVLSLPASVSSWAGGTWGAGRQD